MEGVVRLRQEKPDFEKSPGGAKAELVEVATRSMAETRKKATQSDSSEKSRFLKLSLGHGISGPRMRASATRVDHCQGLAWSRLDQAVEVSWLRG